MFLCPKKPSIISRFRDSFSFLFSDPFLLWCHVREREGERKRERQRKKVRECHTIVFIHLLSLVTETMIHWSVLDNRLKRQVWSYIFISLCLFCPKLQAELTFEINCLFAPSQPPLVFFSFLFIFTDDADDVFALFHLIFHTYLSLFPFYS